MSAISRTIFQGERLAAANDPVPSPGQISEQDFELMRRIANRDQEALWSLYDRYAKWVCALGLRMLHDRADADDLVSEVFWEVWKKADRFDPTRGSAKTYISTLTRSRAIDRQRSGNHRAKNSEDAQNSKPVATEAENEGNPFDHAVHDERRERVRSALRQLDPKQREALELVFFEGLSQSEISIRLSKPLGTIKTTIRQGYIRLRDCLRIYKE
jgi:RNA polymerase sigma-70 factor (ECF subfamily)